MKRTRVPLKVRIACREWAQKMKIPPAQYPVLLEMAVKSYKNLSLAEREKWTLKQIMDQNIHL